MDLEKEYRDSQNIRCNILGMVNREPEWAANRIQAGERALAILSEEQRVLAESGTSHMEVQKIINGMIDRIDENFKSSPVDGVCVLSLDDWQLIRKRLS